MRALVFDGELKVAEVPVPRPEPGEALVRVLTAGICNTDLEIIKGYMGFQGIIGHEFVGLVEEAPSQELVGTRVVGEINCVCHQCQCCRMEMPRHCTARSVLGIENRDGAFAEYLTLPEENLHPAPSSVRDDVAVFTEPLAAAFRIPEQVVINPEDRIIVLGDGKLGQLIAQALHLYSRHLVCVGRHAWKLKLLAALGIAVVQEDAPVERGADIVAEATGAPEGLRRALELVRPEGTIILKSTVAQPTALDFSVPVINEVRILGSRCGPFRPALEALSMGNVEVRPMISEVLPLQEGVRAMERAAQSDVMKVLLHM
jgi:threonine dehydrogenase-like Zn-dependent dehydrogenase